MMTHLTTTVRRYLELIRFSHTIFAMPFAIAAAVLAWTSATTASEPPGFSIRQGVGLVLCLISARTAAMAFNRLVDRRFDAANPRTAGRHLPAGLVTTSGVVALTVFSSLVFVSGTLLFLPNVWPVVLALPVLAFLLGYSYAKRFTRLVHYWLGCALALAPVCAWLAIRGLEVWATPSDLIPAVLMGAGVLFWVAGFDILYASQDAEFDRQAGLQSLPARVGISAALRIAAVSHGLAWLCWLAIPFSVNLGGPALPLGYAYSVMLVVVAVFLVSQHSLVSPTRLERVNLAFFHLNAVISALMLASVIIDAALATAF